MTVRHMKIFIIVYQLMNITKAAEELHMTQPAVSRAIQEMEHYYGVCLFDRINKRLYRTECSDDLYTQAVHIVDSFDQLEKGLKNWDQLGVLRVGASITLGNFMIPPLVKEFQKNYPHLKIKISINSGTKIQEQLLENKIDLALIEGTVESEYLCKEEFSKDYLVLIFSPEDLLHTKSKIYMKDLADRQLLLRESGSVGRTLLNHIFAVHELPLEPAWESVSTQAIIKGVKAGLGISFLPAKLVEEEVEKGTIETRIVEDESFSRSNYIVWHKNKNLTKAAMDFIKLCQSHHHS